MAAQEVAQSVPEAFSVEELRECAAALDAAMPDNGIPVYRDDKLIDWFDPATGKLVSSHVERVAWNERRLRNRNREYEATVACYFIGGETGPVKIGYTENLERRLKTLQGGSPVELALLAWTGGGIFTEMEYHERFAAHRLHGEWFERVPEIEAEIARLNAKE